jgi:hypothetical protein
MDDLNAGEELNEYVMLKSKVVDKDDQLYKDFLYEIHKEKYRSNVFRYISTSDMELEDDESTKKFELLIDKFFSE